jgi:TolC family type I secretion outer membrane protein
MRGFRSSRGAILLALWAGLGAEGCATLTAAGPEGTVAPSSALPWTPPPGAAPRPASPRPPEIPEDLRARASTLTLTDVVDVALRNSPRTRESWWRARAAAAEIDIRRAALLPEIDAEIEGLRERQALSGGEGALSQTLLGPGLTLNYLLFDFGGRRADVEAARQALFADNYLHNQTIQDVVLQVERAYYQYQGTKALLAAAQTSLQEAQTNLQAADERRRAGVATVTDVLQSRTALAQGQLDVESLEGQLQAVRGGLAAAMGLPANVPYDVAPLPEDLAPRPTGETVEALIGRALGGRPDVEAARAQALAAASDVARERAGLRPRLSFQAGLNTAFYGSSLANPGGLYSGALVLSYPLFDAGGRASRVRQSEADLEASRAHVVDLEQQATLQVWTDYADLRTAAQRIETSRTLLQNAQESERATSERYRAGVGSILDLLTAQSALASARAQEVQARADWLLALAQIAHDTGSLGPAPGKGNP